MTCAACKSYSEGTLQPPAIEVDRGGGRADALRLPGADHVCEPG